MKPLHNLTRISSLLLGAALLGSVSSAFAQGTFTDNGATQPAFDGADQGYFDSASPSTSTGQDKWFFENSAAGQPKGQTFTVTSPVEVKAMSYRLRATNKPPTVNYLVRIGAVDTATNTFYPVHEETITQTTDWGTKGVTDDSIGTWTLDSPVTLPALPAGTVYGFDITMTSNTTGWQQGIPYPLSTGNVFAGGNMYSTPLGGAAGVPTNTMNMNTGNDREFHLDMDATTITDTTAPTLTSIEDQVGGGPIYEDQVQVAYILNFDEAIDETTIDLADFENLGSGVSLDSLVSVTQTTPFPVASSIRVVFGISGTGTLKLGVKDDSDIADHYDNTLNAPVADDTTIDVLSGSNPSGGDRFWDGNITSGVTDGVSQGGNGTWDTTTTNWDPGFGFANPNAWNNANNDTAILGGANGVATLAEPITVGGIRIDNRNIDISGSTLTFGVAGEINSTDVGNQNDPPTISSKISGAAITKTGAGYIQLTNNANDFAAFTLSAGTLGQLPGGTYTGIGTGLFTINGGGFFVTNNDETIIDNDTVWNGNWFTQNVSNAAKTTTWNGNVTLGGSVQVASKHRQVFNGDIDETGGARKLTFTNSGGASWIALNGDNSFTGGVQVNQGTLNINSPTAIGTGLLTLNAPNVVLDNTSGSAITLSTNNTQAWNQNFAFTGTNDLNLGTGAANINNNRTVTITAGTLTVGGGITQSGGTRTLAKAGNGTLVLGGANSYAGNTTVSAGTLALVGGSQNSAITVNSGAALGFALGSPTTSSKAVTLSTGHAIAITGTVNNSSDYLLMSATSFTGTPTLSAAITDYELELREGDTELWLAYTGISGPTPPELLTIANDVDNGPVLVNTPVTYTLTFSKDMDATTIDAGDFSNAGTSNISIGSIDEVSPTVFTVVVTPTSEGILQLQINQDAVIEDVDELALDTTSAIIDAIEITVEDPPAPSSPFDDWATGGELFNDDASGDGIANGLAFLLGADGPGDNALDLLPTSTEDGGALVLTFSMRNADERGDATLSVEYGNDLAGWTTVLIPDVAGETVVGDVTFNITLGDPLNSVTASIASGAANAGKLFARLSGDDGVAD